MSMMHTEMRRHDSGGSSSSVYSSIEAESPGPKYLRIDVTLGGTFWLGVDISPSPIKKDFRSTAVRLHMMAAAAAAAAAAIACCVIVPSSPRLDPDVHPADTSLQSDPICQHSLIGMRQLLLAIEIYNHHRPMAPIHPLIRMLPYQLNPHLTEKPMQRSLYREAKYGSRENAEAFMDRTEEKLRQVGITPCREGLVSSTHLSHRLQTFALLRHPSHHLELCLDLMLAYHTTPVDTSNRAFLAELGVKHGLFGTTSEALTWLAGDEYDHEVNRAYGVARRLGVTGIPFFVFQGRWAASGALSVEEFVKLLQNIMRRESIGSTAPSPTSTIHVHEPSKGEYEHAEYRARALEPDGHPDVSAGGKLPVTPGSDAPAPEILGNGDRASPFDHGLSSHQMRGSRSGSGSYDRRSGGPPGDYPRQSVEILRNERGEYHQPRSYPASAGSGTGPGQQQPSAAAFDPVSRTLPLPRYMGPSSRHSPARSPGREGRNERVGFGLSDTRGMGIAS
ncbi:thioredoxin-like protein [Kockovaella imperatae]|uniref:Thioredoxin-like protein n=1 Tax=Kockovaella imperatae TaxID=4999 RepID=A0A1Y1ULL1_9TREE|nr:thioredoxin-like protein [Kockovaella imperatae]ORX38005.1 thioredoxin-like protein [Kockovaella imperatae]